MSFVRFSLISASTQGSRRVSERPGHLLLTGYPGHDVAREAAGECFLRDVEFESLHENAGDRSKGVAVEIGEWGGAMTLQCFACHGTLSFEVSKICAFASFAA